MPVEIPASFLPARRRGMILHSVVGALFLAGSVFCLVSALQQQVGGVFVLLLLLSLLLFAPLPLIFYRAYALMNAGYTLERDGLRIRWGLRAEDIPLPAIEWVRPAAELGFRLPLPPLSAPGAILGSRQVAELGLVEFLASDTGSLLVIATTEKVYAVSPQDTRSFVRAFQYAIELGSLTPLAPYSAQPAAFARRVWDVRPARIFLVAGLVLTTALLVLVAFLIPAQGQISLGFDTRGQPLPPVPAEQLLLLPVLAIFAFVSNLGVGMYFFRRDSDRPVAFLLWFISAFTPLLFILAVLFNL